MPRDSQRLGVFGHKTLSPEFARCPRRTFGTQTSSRQAIQTHQQCSWARFDAGIDLVGRHQRHKLREFVLHVSFDGAGSICQLDGLNRLKCGVRRAVYPGSFDPPTLGHLDLVDRAARLFDEVIVAVGVNSTKQPFLAAEDRVRALRACAREHTNVGVDQFDGLLVDFVRSVDAQCIVRGLRATSDFDYEFQIAMANRRLAPEIETVFLMTNWEHSFLSSSIVREVATLGGDYRGFVHPAVAEIIESRPR